jgi:hypothetical protein
VLLVFFPPELELVVLEELPQPAIDAAASPMQVIAISTPRRAPRALVKAIII